MLDWLFSIGEAVSSFLQFLLNSVVGMFKLVGSIPQMWTFVSNTIAFVPSEVSYFIMFGFFITITFLLLKVVL